MIVDRILLWAAGALLALLASTTALQTFRLGAAKRATAELRLVIEQERRQAAEVALSQQEAARIEERRRSMAAQEVERVARNQAARARADGGGARAAGDGLRVRAAALAADCDGAAGHPAAAGLGPPARGGCGVLADVLGQVVEEAIQLARIADERGIAGAACERAYDSLSAGDSSGDFGAPAGKIGGAAPIRIPP